MKPYEIDSLPFIDHYERLGVRPGATVRECDLARRRLSKSTHPDPTRPPDLNLPGMAEINESHVILTTEAERYFEAWTRYRERLTRRPPDSSAIDSLFAAFRREVEARDIDSALKKAHWPAGEWNWMTSARRVSAEWVRGLDRVSLSVLLGCDGRFCGAVLVGRHGPDYFSGSASLKGTADWVHETCARARFAAPRTQTWGPAASRTASQQGPSLG